MTTTASPPAVPDEAPRTGDGPDRRSSMAAAERRLVRWFTVTVGLLLALEALSFCAARKAVAMKESVIQTGEVLGELDKTVSWISDAEKGERGYLLTGDDDYLEPYREAVARLSEHRPRLRALMANEPDQRQQLSLLERGVAGEVGDLEQAIAVRHTRGLSAAQQLVLSNGSRDAEDEIRPVAATMQAAEYRKRDGRSAASEASGRAALLTFLASGLMAPAILGILYYQVRRSLTLRTHLFAEERAARREAQAANRVKDEFLATVSHELRTPLTAILGWTHMLRGGRFDAPGFARGLDVIERNARAQTQLIEDLLDVSRIISGKLRLERRSIDFVSVVEAAIDAVRPAAEAKTITVIGVFDRDSGPVAIDGGRMQQVVWNLLSNAVKFTPEGGHVEARLRRSDSQVELTVRDNGQGISAEFLPHAFDMFRQADASSVRAQSGLGLGLALARRIVEMHGGTIQASSPGSGKGAVFTVTLPCGDVSAESYSSAPETRPGASAAPSLPDLGSVRVLAVDISATRSM